MEEDGERGQLVEEFDEHLSGLAVESIDLVIESIVGLIQKGAIARHRPVEGWGATKVQPQKETVDRLARQRRYNRITKLLNKAENGQLDTQALASLNSEIDKGAVKDAAPEDVILQDLSFLVKAKEERLRVKEARTKAAEQLKKAEKKAKLREIELDRLQQEDAERRKAWEEEMLAKLAEEKQSRRVEIQAKKEAQQKAEAAAKKQARRLRAKLKEQQGADGPLFAKLEKQYEEKVHLPELERNQKYLESRKNFFNKPVKDLVTEHKNKLEEQPKREPKQFVAHTEMKVFKSKAYADAVKQSKALTEEEERVKRVKLQGEYAQNVKSQNLQKIKLYKEKGGILNSLVVPVAPEKLAEDRRKKGEENATKHQDFLKQGKEELLKNPVKREFTAVVKEKSPEPVKQTDYLQQIKAQKRASPHPKGNSKADEAAQLQARANRKEKDLAGDFSSEGLANAAEVSEMYVEVAKKKLAMLK